MNSYDEIVNSEKFEKNDSDNDKNDDEQDEELYFETWDERNMSSLLCYDKDIGSITREYKRIVSVQRNKGKLNKTKKKINFGNKDEIEPFNENRSEGSLAQFKSKSEFDQVKMADKGEKSKEMLNGNTQALVEALESLAL